MGNILSRISFIVYGSTFAAVCVLGLGAFGEARADDAPAAPQENFLSSLKQAFRQDFDKAVVRGHFDVGIPPDTRRYYCLVDAKTGKRQANGVSGEPSVRRDGMTGIKVGAVSLYDCASAEQQGILVTSGYVLDPKIRAAAAAPVRAAATMIAPAEPATTVPPAVAAPLPAFGQADVAGVRLGMSPDEVRAVLRAKKLADYYEAADSLQYSAASNGTIDSGLAARFVNVIEAWTPTPGGESFQVMFTPVPGKERAMAIIHTMAYSASEGPSSTALGTALMKKYGGSAAAKSLSVAQTWRIQNNGEVKSDDACERRAILGGIGSIELPPAAKANLALKTTSDEFRYQIERCGVAVITADQMTATSSGGEEPRVTRFTVTAYGPEVAFEGSTSASKWMQAAKNAASENLAASGAGAPVPPL